MGELRSIVAARAERAKDNAAWTPRDLLVELLRRVDSGEESHADACLVVMISKREDGALRTSTWRANLKASEETELRLCGLLRYALDRFD